MSEQGIEQDDKIQQQQQQQLWNKSEQANEKNKILYQAGFIDHSKKISRLFFRSHAVSFNGPPNFIVYLNQSDSGEVLNKNRFVSPRLMKQ